MADEVRCFEHPDFGVVRGVNRGGSPWFYAEDVAKALGYASLDDALAGVPKGDHGTYSASDGTLIPVVNAGGVWIMMVCTVEFDEGEPSPFWEWFNCELIPTLRQDEDPLSLAAMLGKIYKQLKGCKKRVDALLKENEELRVKCASVELKAAHFDALVEDAMLTTLDEAAERIGLRPEEFAVRLLGLGYLDTDETGYLSVCDERNDGLFVKTCKVDGKARPCCKSFSVTPKGFVTFRLLFRGHNSQQ